MEDKIQRRRYRGDGTCGWTYFLGFLAAFIYYVQHTTGFWLGVVAFLKALVWPAFLVYKAFELLKM